MSDKNDRETCFNMHGISILVIVFLTISGICYAGIILTDVTEESGIDFIHKDGSNGMRYIVENLASGLCLFDYDNDGDIDIYLVSGAAMKGTTYEKAPTNRLYRNDGGMKFVDVTDTANVGDTGHGLGVTAADYDNDGDQDLYVSNFGPNVLYRNNGDGTFTDVTKSAGVDNGNLVGAGVNFIDIDADGDLDLFAASYIDFKYENHVPSKFKGFPLYVGPRLYKKTPNTLYRNNGDGTFTDISKESGISGHLGSGMGTVCVDFDNDGDSDIYVANDMWEDFLFENDGTGKFNQIGLSAGIAYDVNGDEMGSMGICCGDYNNDGLFDFYLTSYQEQSSVLFRNLGNGLFEDITMMAGAGEGTVHNIAWGNGFVDFDNDGDRDMFVAMGHLQDNIEKWDDRSTFHATNILYRNEGNGKFTNISDQSGDGMKVKLSSRGAAFNDLDNDGDVDVVICNIRDKATILRNESTNKGNWLEVRLKGKKSNYDGVGAKVKVILGDLVLVDEVHSGHGYQSHFGMRLHFGLGRYSKVDRIEVRWIGGENDIYTNISANQIIILREGLTLQEFIRE